MRVPRRDVADDGLGALAAQVATLQTDVAALGRGVASLTQAVRAGATTTPASDDGDEEETKGQPDWLTVTDPEAARTWMAGAVEWLAGPGRWHGLDLAPCWVLHPDVVADVLALSAERTAAYTSVPSVVLDYLGRWLPDTRARITQALTGCTEARAHKVDGQMWDCTDLDPATVATWWATDRDRPAPTALLLPSAA